MEIKEIITILREDYLSDVFEGWEDATDAEKNDQFLWPDKALFRYLTEAERQACNRTDFLYDDTTSNIVEITLVEGQRDYAISNKITVIEGAWYNSQRIEHISVQDRDLHFPDWQTASGLGSNSLGYWVRRRKLFLTRIPDAVDAGTKIYLRVYRLPLESITSVSDEFEIPEEYQRDLIQWALYEAYMKSDADGYDKAKSDTHLVNFNQAFGQYVPSEVRLNQLQEPSRLTPRAVNYLGKRTNEDAEWD